MIAIVDYGIGNLGSVRNALRSIGAAAELAANPDAVAAADAVVLPGVGNFGRCARALAAADLDVAVHGAHARGVPILAICVGMQLLFAGSDEDPSAVGLGILPGSVRRLDAARLPHVGWNLVDPIGGFLRAPTWFYFTHSYAAEPFYAGVWAGVTTYAGDEFVSAVKHAGIIGVQFHPEKSGRDGLAFLRAFATLTAGVAG